MEILRQLNDPIDAIFVPVGGGGIIAGIAAYVKFLHPEIKIIGVESTESACLHAALAAGRRVTLPHVGIFADGVAVAQIGKHTWEVCKDNIDDVITVTPDELCAAIKDIFDDTRSVAEPAGALGVAGMKKYVEREGIKGQTLVAIESGANMNFDRLRYISERTEIGEKREAILAVTLPEKPGSYKKFIKALHKRNITEFNYRYAHGYDAQVFVGVQISQGGEGREKIVAELQEQGYRVIDMTDNETAKLHIRHMVGGRSEGVGSERVYRFEFPERPGALMKFLNSLGTKWNISMFHYRNHGAAYSRVLMGVQVDESERETFQHMLNEIGFRYWEETNNEAYQVFLRGK